MLTFLLSMVLLLGVAGPAAAASGAGNGTSTIGATHVAATTGLLLAPTPGATLKRGDKGAQVKALQLRLRELRYWVGDIDGVFGNLTQQALFAFQKQQGLEIDGVYGPNTAKALAKAKRPGARSASGTWVEIDKGRQVLKFVRGGTVKWIFNTSTGTEKPYTYKGKRYMADTPKGKWKIFRQVKGWRDGELGLLYNPKYFHVDGIAIHGYNSVPPYPASHGCARVSMDASDFLWSRIKIGTKVWIY